MEMTVLALTAARRLDGVDDGAGGPDDASEAPVVFGRRRSERKKMTGKLSQGAVDLFIRRENGTAL